ncbi:MAG: glycosyltransferase family 4 protein [Anaerolineae bacterium]|nr:glycosyltransferase family 4 protein [Anaerolineae bacterium]
MQVYRKSAPSKPAKLLYVVNIPRFFVSHRLPLALAARAEGFDVQVAASDADPESAERIAAAGLPFHPLPLSQHGLNPLRELRTIFALRRLYKRLEPDLLHHVSIKPVIYGGIAAKLSRRRSVIQAMSGLGYLHVSEQRRARLLEKLSRPAFKFALAGAGTVMIFQNPDDRHVFVMRGLVAAERTVVIRGSGVDEMEFAPRPEDRSGLPVVLFAGRLLWEKGVGEFVELARRLKGQARFRVVGYEEPSSPSNVPAAQLQAWHEAGIIEWRGQQYDMARVFGECNIVCLPSTYGEGVPKVLIEAAACGRACVTTDTPGCREIVRHGANGLLVPPKDQDALREAVKQLVEDPELRRSYGAKGREIALQAFTLRRVAEETIALYQSLLEGDR